MTLAWFHPESFSRVFSWIGSFTPLRSDPSQDQPGADTYAAWVRAEKRNLRIWISEGSHDINVGSDGQRDLALAGSWPLANLQLANSLALSGYDVRLSYGQNGHNSALAATELADTLRWLWRDYDGSIDHVEFTPSEMTPGVHVEVTEGAG